MVVRTLCGVAAFPRASDTQSEHITQGLHTLAARLGHRRRSMTARALHTQAIAERGGRRIESRREQ